MDRNLRMLGKTSLVTQSLSARRAWIEIQNDGPSFSVREGRSPQGERG